MSKNIYKGYNFIYEQMAGDQPKKEASVNPLDIVSQIYTFVNTLVLLYKGNEVSNPDGFESLMGPIKGSGDLNSFKNSITSVIGSIDFPGGSGKSEAESYISGLFDQLMKIPDVNSKTKDIQAKLSELVDASKSSLGKSMAVKEAEKIILEKGFGYLDGGGGTGSSTSTVSSNGVDQTPSNKWYIELANYVLDLATAFKSETTPPLLPEEVAKDPQIKAILPKAAELMKKAQGLQIDRKRKGFVIKGKIVTQSGDMKGRDFRIACENLIDDIKRNMGALSKAKSSITKVAPPPVVVPPPPAPPTNADPAQSKDPNKPSPKPATPNGDGSCKFPIAVSLHVCDQVKKLQIHLMGIPCIKVILEKHGGADGKYGKYTSLISNVVYSVITKNDKFSSSVLTQEMYDAIMKFPVKTNENIKELRDNKVFEEEAKNNSEVLKFDSFQKVVNNNKNLFEQENKISDIDVICKKINDKISSIGGDKPIPGPDNKKDEDTSEERKDIPTPDDWEGIKYVKTGSYPVAFDEDLVTFWTKEAAITAASFAIPGSGYLLKAGSSALRSLGTKAAARVGAKKLASKMAVKGTEKVLADKLASKSISLPRYYMAKYSKVPIPARTKAGLLGGTVGGAALDFLSGKNSVVITVNEGFIDRTMIMMISKGLVDTIDGYVSDEDYACITTVLSIVKGAWTVDENDKPVSAWKELKSLYKTSEGENLVNDIRSISPKMGDVEGYPNTRSTSPLQKLSDVDWRVAKKQTEALLKMLEANESQMATNISKLPADYVKAQAEGNYIEVDENGDAIESENSENSDEKK